MAWSAGSALDLEAEKLGLRRLPTRPTCARLQAMKTGALHAPLRVKRGPSWDARRAPSGTRSLELRALRSALAFQIADDLLDIEGDAAAMGKAVGKDAAKATLHAASDAATAKARLGALAAEAVAALASFGPAAETSARGRELRRATGEVKGSMSATSPNATVPLRGNRFLIVGGASLVGSATAELLLREGAAEVTVLDSFFQGSAENIKHLEGDKRLKLVQGDVMRLPQLHRRHQGCRRRAAPRPP